jgi:hypothetical protein
MSYGERYGGTIFGGFAAACSGSGGAGGVGPVGGGAVRGQRQRGDSLGVPLARGGACRAAGDGGRSPFAPAGAPVGSIGVAGPAAHHRGGDLHMGAPQASRKSVLLASPTLDERPQVCRFSDAEPAGKVSLRGNPAHSWIARLAAGRRRWTKPHRWCGQLGCVCSIGPRKIGSTAHDITSAATWADRCRYSDRNGSQQR